MRKYAVIIALLAMATFIQPSIAATWTIEKVTDNTESDFNPFVVAVQSGLLVVYTHNDADDEVFVANNFSGSWVSNRVTDNTYSDIGLDIAAKYNEQMAHIPVWWQDVPDQEISYCKGSGTTWNISRITDDAFNDAWPSIALDKNGFVHIVYQKNVGGDWEIFYANNVSGSWLTEQVTDNAVDDVVPWFALDKAGNPHIVFVRGTTIGYTKKAAGIWTDPEPITLGGGVNSLPFIVLDNNDKAHITYAKSDGVHNQIYYANNVTGTWQESKVTNTAYDNLFPTIFVDPSANAHIAYVAAEPGDLEMFYATNTAGIWSTGRITDNSSNDGGIMGRYFTCDANRIGHVFFWNNSDGDNEIYHAKSNEPLYVGVEESVPSPSPSTLTVAPIISANSNVSYTVPAFGSISLKVYDASGSLVRTLVSGTSAAGAFSASWNGTTDSGSKANGGVYFFRLVTSAGSVSAKTILK
jgi:hypothetical protein